MARPEGLKKPRTQKKTIANGPWKRRAERRNPSSKKPRHASSHRDARQVFFANPEWAVGASSTRCEDSLRAPPSRPDLAPEVIAS